MPEPSRGNRQVTPTEATVVVREAPGGPAGAAPTGSQPSRAQRPDPAAILLALEAEVRAQASVIELRYHLANESARLLPHRQAVLVEAAGDGPRVVCISSLATVDRHQAVVRWYEALARQCLASAPAGPLSLDRAALAAVPDASLDELPFSQALWLPIQEPGRAARGHLLLFSQLPWSPAQMRIGQRLATTYAHAWRALEPAPRPARAWLRAGRTRWMVAAALVLAAAWPVSFSALAPVEVTAGDPMVVAAPLSGVVAEMLVAPNVEVSAGQPIVRFEDTRLRNELQLSERRLQVAQARLAGTTQAAIDNSTASREVAINRSERDLAQAQYDYARELLDQSVLKAPGPGVVLYSDPRDWQGRPVETGQQILRLADPRRVEFTIQLPVQDSVMIRPQAAVRVYLDSDPLRPLQAVLERASYQAARTEYGSFAYRLTARIEPGEAGEAALRSLRIGMRGTAQVYGRQVPLIYALLRRPVSALRQTIGW